MTLAVSSLKSAPRRANCARCASVFQVLSQKLVLQRPSRPNTKPATIAECLVGDATGCIILTARNEQGKHALFTSTNSCCNVR